MKFLNLAMMGIVVCLLKIIAAEDVTIGKVDQVIHSTIEQIPRTYECDGSVNEVENASMLEDDIRLPPMKMFDKFYDISIAEQTSGCEDLSLPYSTVSILVCLYVIF
jgi:hypothetical protein